MCISPYLPSSYCNSCDSSLGSLEDVLPSTDILQSCKPLLRRLFFFIFWHLLLFYYYLGFSFLLYVQINVITFFLSIFYFLLFSLLFCYYCLFSFSFCCSTTTSISVLFSFSSNLSDSVSRFLLFSL